MAALLPGVPAETKARLPLAPKPSESNPGTKVALQRKHRSPGEGGQLSTRPGPFPEGKPDTVLAGVVPAEGRRGGRWQRDTLACGAMSPTPGRRSGQPCIHHSHAVSWNPAPRHPLPRLSLGNAGEREQDGPQPLPPPPRVLGAPGTCGLLCDPHRHSSHSPAPDTCAHSGGSSPSSLRLPLRPGWLHLSICCQNQAGKGLRGPPGHSPPPPVVRSAPLLGRSLLWPLGPGLKEPEGPGRGSGLQLSGTVAVSPGRSSLPWGLGRPTH